MIILGVVLLVLGLLLALPILFYVGAVLIVVGLVLLLMFGVFHGSRDRRWYW